MTTNTLSDLREQMLTALHHVNAALPMDARCAPPIHPADAAEVIRRVRDFVAFHGQRMAVLRDVSGQIDDVRELLGLGHDQEIVAAVRDLLLGTSTSTTSTAPKGSPMITPLSAHELVIRWIDRLNLDRSVPQSLILNPGDLASLHQRLLELEAQAAEAFTGGFPQPLAARIRHLADGGADPLIPLSRALTALCNQAETDRTLQARLAAEITTTHELSTELVNVVAALPLDLREPPPAEGVRQLVGRLERAVRGLDAACAQCAPMATTLQAITEALPAESRYTEDIAGAVRQLVLTCATRYSQWSQLREETAPQKQIVGILRELLADSKPLCIALACELYSTDPSLLELLETLPAERLAATLMESLAVPHDQPIPTTEAPSPQAKALEGLCSVAFRRYPLRPGRLEAIGGNLLRFKPKSGGELILNADRKDLEVYPLDTSDLSPSAAEVADLKAAVAQMDRPSAQPPDPEDIPW